MELAQYFAIVVISCSFILYVVDGDAPIMSKKYIGDKDSFDMTCNGSSFRDMYTSDYSYIKRLKMYRKLESKPMNDFEFLGMIEALKPTGRDTVSTNIPNGRQWNFTYGGLRQPNVFITLVVKDATKADVGLYWCEAELYETETKHNSTQFNLRPLGENRVPLINKREVGNNDSFIMSCDATSFREVNIPKTNYFTRLMIYRQLEGKEEEVLGMIEAYLPPGDDEHKYENIPEGRNMEITIGGFKGFENRNTIFMNLTVKDATCSDAGYYWCGLRAPRTTRLFFSPKFQLKPKATTSVKMNPIKVTPTKGASFNTSQNNEGDVVTMECTFIGFRSMTPTWSLNNLYNQHNQNVKVFDPERAIGADSCTAYSHKSTKTVVLYRTFRDPIYYCRAFSLNGSDTGVFAVMKFILPLNDDFEESKSQAMSLNSGNKTVLVFLLVDLVLVICYNFRLLYYH